MSLRRLAHTNYAASPRSSLHSSSPAQPSSLPVTPKPRISIGTALSSPSSTPSISSSAPFDWDAARSRKPPPYASPPARGRKSLGGTPKRVVRTKGIFQRISSIPSTIAFELSLFPHNLPLPEPMTSARLIGGTMHFLHLCVRVCQVRDVPDSDLGWEDMYREDGGHSWFDWTIPVTLLLLCASLANTLYFFTRSRIYRLHHHQNSNSVTTPLPSSPNASLVSSTLDFSPLSPPPISSRIWYYFSAFWRFLLYMDAPKSLYANENPKAKDVVQLEVWTPGEGERVLFAVYSPVHAFLWMATTSANWMLLVLVMVLVGAQMHTLTRSYETLLKDREIIAAEVMHEYNEGFVYRRINPVRKDVAVMTHQSEVVNVWEGY